MAVRIFICTAENCGFPAAASLSLIGIGVMYGKLMLPDVLLPKLLDGYPATFERSEGLNDFVVRVNGADRTISREAWRSLLDQTRSAVDQPKPQNEASALIQFLMAQRFLTR